MPRKEEIATIQEVARRAGVAPSSVSRVFNDHPQVSPAMRRRVLRAAEALGYQPDPLARGLRSGTTYVAGFVLRDISNPLFADIAKGAEDGLRQAGYSMLLANSEGSPDLDVTSVQVFQRRRVDGLILALQSESYPPTLEALERFPGALVLMDREIEGLTAGAILCDHRTGVQAAVSHLLALGHRRIGLLAGPDTIRVTRERIRGYMEAHRAHGFETSPHLLRLGSYTERFGYEQTLALFRSGVRPTALVAAGVQLAVGVLFALRELALRPGHDLALVSCDETELMRAFEPPISAVTRDAYRIGQKAAEMLIAIMLHGRQPGVEVLPTTYVPRGTSVAPLSREAGSSVHEKAAADVDRGARDERGVIAGEKGDQAG
jgi:LacI family transcriptional regulator